MKNAGLLSAVCVSAVAGLLSTWCLLLVLDTAQTLRRHGHTVRAMSDIGRCLFGASGKAVVDTCVVLSQLGFCVAYCVFVAENVQAMLFEVQGGMVAPESLQRSCNLTGLLANAPGQVDLWYIIASIDHGSTPLHLNVDLDTHRTHIHLYTYTYTYIIIKYSII